MSQPKIVAFAGSLPGLRAYVTRLGDFREIEDWTLAGFPVTPERLGACLPARLRYIVYQDDGVDHPFARLLPGFERTLLPL